MNTDKREFEEMIPSYPCSPVFICGNKILRGTGQ
jgi:hypothetical protein